MMGERLPVEASEVEGLTDQELAFQIWALETDRSPSKTCTILERRYGRTVQPGTVSQWTRRHDWHQLANELFHAAAPQKLQRLAVRVMNASEQAQDYLEQVLTGSAPTNAKGEVDKVRAMVALEYLRMVGFVPPRASDVSATGTSFQRAMGAGVGSDGLSSMSVEELESGLAARGIRVAAIEP